PARLRQETGGKRLCFREASGKKIAESKGFATRAEYFGAMIATDNSKRAKHAKYVLTPWSKQAGLNAPTMDRAEGVYLYDTDDNRYLDLSAGLVAVNLGHGNDAVATAIGEQAKRLAYASPQFTLDVRADLAEK